VSPHQASLRMALAVPCLLAAVHAQNWAVRATIPFDFTADQQAFAAGEYCISTDGSEAVRLAHVDVLQKAEIVTVRIRSTAEATPRIVFHRYAERHFLAEVWLGEPNRGRQVYASAAELELARTTKQEVTTIIATLVPTK